MSPTDAKSNLGTSDFGEPSDLGEPRDLGEPSDFGEPSALDALDLDPSSSLAELAEALRDVAQFADPEHREAARRAFERLTERPERHFDELLRTVPREAATPRASAPKALVPALSLRDVVPPRSLAALLGPKSADERRLSAPSSEDA